MSDYDFVMNFIAEEEIRRGRKLEVKVIDLVAQREAVEAFWNAFENMQEVIFAGEDDTPISSPWTPGMSGTKE